MEEKTLKERLEEASKEYTPEDISKMSEEDYQKVLDKEVEESVRVKLVEEATTLCTELYDRDISEVNPFYKQSTIEELKKFIITLKKEIEAKKEAKESTKGKYLLKRKWKSYFNKLVLKQPLYCILYFYAFMSVVFFHDFRLIHAGLISEDIRVHPGLIGPTGTGKSFSNGLLARTVKQIPKRIYVDSEGEEHTEYFTVVFPSKFTDAGLIGNLDAELYKKQIEKNIKPYIEKEGKQFPNPRYINPIFEGALRRGDLVIFDEARKVFTPNKDSSEVQTILCNAMNNFGSEENRLGNDSASSKGIVEFNCAAVIVLTSVPVKRFDELIYAGGLMQRMSVIIDGDDPDKRKLIRKKYLEGHINCDEEGNMEKFNEKADEFKQEEKDFIEYVTQLKLKNMKYKETWAPDDRQIIGVPPSVVKKAEEYCNMISDNNFLTIVQQDTHESNISRLMRKILIYTAINSISEGRIITQVSDVDEAYLDLITAENISMLDFLRQNLNDTKEDDENIRREMILKTFLLRSGKIKKMELIDAMTKEWNVSKVTVNTYLKKFKRRKVYEEVKEGTTKYCFIEKNKSKSNNWK